MEQLQLLRPSAKFKTKVSLPDITKYNFWDAHVKMVTKIKENVDFTVVTFISFQNLLLNWSVWNADYRPGVNNGQRVKFRPGRYNAYLLVLCQSCKTIDKRQLRFHQCQLFGVYSWICQERSPSSRAHASLYFTISFFHVALFSFH